MNVEKFIERANFFGSKQIPFLFITDFELEKPEIFPLRSAAEENVLFKIKNTSNFHETHVSKPIEFNFIPISYEQYLQAFNIVHNEIINGNSYLLNLTFPTNITTNYSLLELFNIAQAPFKLYFKDEFIVFSPESFIETKDGKIYSYPMKGTIDASIPEAEKIILENKKELWEHNTIVDLIRNDLAIVATNIEVTKFRFISKISTNKKNLLQVSSEIAGDLKNNWQTEIGEILVKLLPAGSISGAPKKMTVEIIHKAEKIKRGYFTGIFGIFDGKELTSAVNIRFIEKTNAGLRFRSGGGITSESNPKSEYQEMIDKVYIPVK